MYASCACIVKNFLRPIHTKNNNNKDNYFNIHSHAKDDNVLFIISVCYSYVIRRFKGIVHFEIKIWYLSAYPKGIQDVCVFFSSVDPILMFLGQTVLVCQSYNGRYRSLSL